MKGFVHIFRNPVSTDPFSETKRAIQEKLLQLTHLFHNNAEDALAR